LPFGQKLAVFAGVATVVAFLVAPRTVARVRLRGWLELGLPAAVVALALLVVGIVSDTLKPHVVQVVPLVAVVVTTMGRQPWAYDASRALLAFWFLIMGAIWLFLLGLASILSGTFSAAEILLTIVIGVACAVGLALARQAPTSPAITRLLVVATFSALQAGAVWLSYQPAFR
jgi:hypothetical protein